jgi:hypothetical protein
MCALLSEMYDELELDTVRQFYRNLLCLLVEYSEQGTNCGCCVWMCEKCIIFLICHGSLAWLWTVCCPFIHVCLSVCLCLYVYLSICLSVYVLFDFWSKWFNLDVQTYAIRILLQALLFTQTDVFSRKLQEEIPGILKKNVGHSKCFLTLLWALGQMPNGSWSLSLKMWIHCILPLVFESTNRPLQSEIQQHIIQHFSTIVR